MTKLTVRPSIFPATQKYGDRESLTSGNSTLSLHAATTSRQKRRKKVVGDLSLIAANQTKLKAGGTDTEYTSARTARRTAHILNRKRFRGSQVAVMQYLEVAGKRQSEYCDKVNDTQSFCLRVGRQMQTVE